MPRIEKQNWVMAQTTTELAATGNHEMYVTERYGGDDETRTRDLCRDS